MRQDEKELLGRRFRFRCGYCGVSERDVGAELTVDHFQPRSQGGTHEPENWIYCCHACNEFKGDFWQPEASRRILHPLKDNLEAHIVEQEDDMLHALSETGAFHIERLHLNRRQLVAYRRERRLLETSRKIQSRLLERFEELDRKMRRIIEQLEQLRRGEKID